MPKLVDTVLNSNVFAARMLAKAKMWRGEQMKFPIKTSQNSTGTSFQGFDTFSTNASDTRRRLAFDPKFYQITVSLPFDEIAGNQSDENKVLDLLSIEVATSAQDMADDIGTLFYADGTGNVNKDFLGLAAHVDDGTSVATFGGLARATFTTLQSTVTASGGNLTLALMSTLWNDVTSGSQKPTAAYAPEAVWSLYEQLLEPKLRINKNVGLQIGEGIKGGTGFTALDYKGIPVLADEKATAQTLFFLNENYLDWHALKMPFAEQIAFASRDIEGNDYSDVKGLGFQWGGWIKPSNAAAVIGHVYLAGELTGTNPKRHGRLTGLTGV